MISIHQWTFVPENVYPLHISFNPCGTTYWKPSREGHVWKTHCACSELCRKCPFVNESFDVTFRVDVIPTRSIQPLVNARFVYYYQQVSCSCLFPSCLSFFFLFLIFFFDFLWFSSCFSRYVILFFFFFSASLSLLFFFLWCACYNLRVLLQVRFLSRYSFVLLRDQFICRHFL